MARPKRGTCIHPFRQYEPLHQVSKVAALAGSVGNLSQTQTVRRCRRRHRCHRRHHSAHKVCVKLCFRVRAELDTFFARRKSTAVPAASHSQTNSHPYFRIKGVSVSCERLFYAARRRLMFRINLFLFSTFPCAALFFAPLSLRWQDFSPLSLFAALPFARAAALGTTRLISCTCLTEERAWK